MKKLPYLILPLLLLFFGCTREIESRLTEVEKRLAKVEEQVKELNSQVSLIQNLINGKYFIQNAAELPDGSGYKLILVDKDGNTVEKTVLCGKDGEDGEDGVTPAVVSGKTLTAITTGRLTASGSWWTARRSVQTGPMEPTARTAKMLLSLSSRWKMANGTRRWVTVTGPMWEKQ